MDIFLVHAFTHAGKGGSPTGVVLQADGLDASQMLRIAQGLAASHTAFVFTPGDSHAPIPVRFFTAAGEIKNCGHGTIAAHHARAVVQGLGPGSTFQQTQEGIQQVDVRENGPELDIYLHQNPIAFRPVEPATVVLLTKALGIGVDSLDPRCPVALASPGAFRFLVGVASVEALAALQPDFSHLRQVNALQGSMGCFVYATDSGSGRIHARMFAPTIGVDEDVINGNSSGCLAAYLQALGGESEIQLDILQGRRFGQEGWVKAIAVKTGDGVRTRVGGTAVVQGRVYLD